MSEEEIKQGNKLIAEFMEIDGIPFPQSEKIQGYFGKSAPYHISWDLLMPVIQKICDICFSDEGYETYDSEYFYEVRDGIPNIETTYEKVVEFINWYNENKKSK